MLCDGNCTITLQGQKAKQEAGQAKKDAGPAKKDARPAKQDTGQAGRGAAGAGVGEDKPKTTRAERRAKQEAERAAKEAGVPKVSPPPATVVLTTSMAHVVQGLQYNRAVVAW